jgi:hypothetical protein
MSKRELHKVKLKALVKARRALAQKRRLVSHAQPVGNWGALTASVVSVLKAKRDKLSEAIAMLEEVA